MRRKTTRYLGSVRHLASARISHTSASSFGVSFMPHLSDQSPATQKSTSHGVINPYKMYKCIISHPKRPDGNAPPPQGIALIMMPLQRGLEP